MRVRSFDTRRALTSTFLASCALQLLNVATGVALARGLGSIGRGELAALLLWATMIASIGMLGVPDAITFSVSSRPDRARAVGRAALKLAGWQSVACSVVTVGAVAVVTSDWPAGAGSAQVIVALVPLYVLASYGMAFLQGLGAFRAFNVMRTLLPFVTACGLFVAVALGALTVVSAVAAYLISYAALVAALAAVARRGQRESRRPDETSGRADARGLLRYGVRSHVSFVATSMNERLDQLLIAVFLAPRLLGVYVVAVTLTSVTAVATSSVSLVALPSIAAMPPGSERDRQVRNLMGIAGAVSIGLTVPLVFLAPWLTTLLFGNEYASAGGVAQILLVAAVFLGTGRVFGSILRGLNQPLKAGVGDVVGLAVTVPALAILLPLFGLKGAALASAVAYLVSASWMGRQVFATFSEPFSLPRGRRPRSTAFLAREGE